MAETSKTTNKSTTKKPANGVSQKKVEAQKNTVDKVESTNESKKIAELEAKIEMLTNLLLNSRQAEPVAPNSLNDEVTIVHLIDRDPGLTTHIQLTNLAIDLNAFGEERTLDRRQAEELAGKYRKLFENGIIAFGANSSDLAKKFALKSVDSYEYAKTDFVKSLGNLSVMDLEDLYNKLCDGHKRFIIEYFKRKIIANDPKFKDIHKIEMLNRVSDGAMSTVILDIQREKENASRNK